MKKIIPIKDVKHCIVLHVLHNNNAENLLKKLVKKLSNKKSILFNK